MKRLFVFIMMSMWGVGNVHAAKIHELQISVIDKESGNPVQGIRLVVSGHTTQKAVCFTDANGRSIHQWEGSRKDIRIAVEDTSGVYRNTNRYLAKAELRKGKIHVKISLRRLPDYSVLFAEFREIDREIDERNRTNGVDLRLYSMFTITRVFECFTCLPIVLFVCVHGGTYFFEKSRLCDRLRFIFFLVSMK